jgi:hydroxyacylglutathione hydrolase
MQLTARIWLVGSGRHGCGLTHAADCHVYLVDCGGSMVLVDTGAGIEPDRITQEIRSAGFAPEQVSHVLLTHGHADHSGGAAYFQRTTGCTIVASSEVAGFLERGDAEAISLDLAKDAGVYPRDYQWQPCSTVQTMADEQVLQVGSSRFTAIASPGHATGHLCYLLPAADGPVLFAGDAVFHGGAIMLQAIADCSIWLYRQTIQRLAQLHVASLFPGHGLPVLQDGQAHIDKAEQIFRTLLPPPNLA